MAHRQPASITGCKSEGEALGARGARAARREGLGEGTRSTDGSDDERLSRIEALLENLQPRELPDQEEPEALTSGGQ
jgi:hypothetical protein